MFEINRKKGFQNARQKKTCPYMVTTKVMQFSILRIHFIIWNFVDLEFISTTIGSSSIQQEFLPTTAADLTPDSILETGRTCSIRSCSMQRANVVDLVLIGLDSWVPATVQITISFYVNMGVNQSYICSLYGAFQQVWYPISSKLGVIRRLKMSCCCHPERLQSVLILFCWNFFRPCTNNR